MFKAGDKFIVEVESAHRMSNGEFFYDIKGFDDLVMRDCILQKLERYKEPTENDTGCGIKIGDEVITENNEKFVVTYIGRHRGIPDEVFGIDPYGKTYSYCIDGVAKTDCHCDYIAAFVNGLSNPLNWL